MSLGDVRQGGKNLRIGLYMHLFIFNYQKRISRTGWCSMVVSFARYTVFGRFHKLKGPVTRVQHGQRMRNEWRFTIKKNEWRWQRRKILRTYNTHYLMMSVHSNDQTDMKRISTDTKKWHDIRSSYIGLCGTRDRAFRESVHCETLLFHIAKQCWRPESWMLYNIPGHHGPYSQRDLNLCLTKYDFQLTTKSIRNSENDFLR